MKPAKKMLKKELVAEVEGLRAHNAHLERLLEDITSSRRTKVWRAAELGAFLSTLVLMGVFVGMLVA